MKKFGKALVLLLVFAVGCFFLMMSGFFNMLSSLTGDLTYMELENKPHVSVLKVEGPIMGSEAILTQIEAIRKNKNSRGIIVRIDSPGGAVGASQEIFTSLKKIKEDSIPVVVSMGNTAASGGYYIALAASKIFANPGTITGSIGVIAQFPVASELMDKIGVDVTTVKSGELKDAGSPFRNPSLTDSLYFQGVIDDTYEQFFGDVMDSRPISADSLKQVADGRILTGRQALGWGLVDSLGGWQEAKSYMASQVQLSQADFYEIPKKRSLWERLNEPVEGSLNKLGQFLSRNLGFGVFYMPHLPLNS